MVAAAAANILSRRLAAMTASVWRPTTLKGVLTTALTAALCGALVAGCGSGSHSDSYRLGYDSGVDWVNAQDDSMLSEQFHNAAEACSTFGQLAQASLSAGKTYAEFMRQAFVGSSPPFTDQSPPADLSNSEFSQGCVDGIGSTDRGKFLVNRGGGSSAAATSTPPNSAGVTSITGAQLGDAMKSYSAGRGLTTTSFDCPGGPFIDGDTATCTFVRADDGASLTVPVVVQIQGGSVQVQPGTPVPIAGG